MATEPSVSQQHPAQSDTYWTACAECHDIHRANERIWKKSRWGFNVGVCPQCGAWLQAPRAELNLQRELPLVTTA